MRFQLALTVSFLLISINAAPVLKRQGAGVGAGCDSIFTDSDTLVGETSRGTGKTAANALPNLGRRQGAGVGDACNYIFTDSDTLVGETSRGAGKSAAQKITLPARQLNGMADGATAPLSKSTYTSGAGSDTDSFLNTVDDQGTQDSAHAGQIVGDEELRLGTTLGGPNGKSGGSRKARQLNGIADGATAPLSKSTYTSGVGSDTDSFLNTVDDQGTQDSAHAGQIVGDEELRLGTTLGGENGKSGGSPPPKKGPK